jgi:Cytochrome P460
MKATAFVGFTAVVAAMAFMASASGQSDGDAAPIYGVKLPAGYRDWPLISVARVGAPLNDLRVKLGNTVAIEAFRGGAPPFPDGTIIARLAWNQVISEENNRALAPLLEKQSGADMAQKLMSESFIAGNPTNVQFMVKDSAKYASTGGWGFAQFDNGKPAPEAVHKTCFTCHAPAKDRDFVFTRYAR